MPTIVQTLGGLADLQPDWWPSRANGSLSLYAGYTADYATMYRTQPNIRVCVDFIARNIAQLGLHVFRRVSDTDRERLAEHGLARLIARPNAAQKINRYRLIHGTMLDLGIYHNAYWLKFRSRGELAIVRVPPPYMHPEGFLSPTKYVLTVNGRRKEYPPEDVVHFFPDSPDSPLMGLSPLESLRRMIAEEEAHGDYREYFWVNAARMGGFIERPADAPEWSDPARDRFATEFKAKYSGPENSGETVILEDGMTWKSASFSSEQSQGVEHRKLTREECARAYHIPLPMVGILDHATFSNIREQHKNLYQDALGPWLVMLEEDIEAQLLPEFADSEGIYVEFNIAEKLKGSFEEQMDSLQKAVGRAFMTPDEARARLNLPSMGGHAEEIGVPVNITVPEGGEMPALPEATPAVQDVQRRTIERQRAALAKRISAGMTVEDAWDGPRWDRELSADLAQLGVLAPLALAQEMNAAHRAQLAAEMEVTVGAA